jgi:hypothetical protein
MAESQKNKAIETRLKPILKILKVIFIVLGVVTFLSALVFGSGVRQDLERNLNLPNTYAIRKVQTGKAIRMSQVGIDYGLKIILFSHYNWGCVTWRFIRLEDETYL